MGVHGDSLRQTVGGAQHHIGGLARHSGQRQQLLHGAGQLAAEPIDHELRGSPDRLRLVAEEAGRANVLLQLLHRDRQVILRSPIPGEERRGHHVDALVGALRGENGGDQQLERGSEIERAGGVRVGRRQALADGMDALPFVHHAVTHLPDLEQLLRFHYNLPLSPGAYMMSPLTAVAAASPAT